MQYEITDDAAIEFSRDFYEALAGGIAVDEALAEARKGVALAIPGTLEWGTPVLFMRTSDGILFDIPAAAAPPAVARDTPVAHETAEPTTNAPDQSLDPVPSGHVTAATRPADHGEADRFPTATTPPTAHVSAERPIDSANDRAVASPAPLAVPVPRETAGAPPSGTRGPAPQPAPTSASAGVPGWSSTATVASGGALAQPVPSQPARRGRLPTAAIFVAGGVVVFLVLVVIGMMASDRPDPSVPAFVPSASFATDTFSPGEAVVPARLPGTGIVFSNDGGELGDLLFLDAAGGGIRSILAAPTDDTWPSWSPDRSRVAFTRVTDGHGEIWTIGFDGSNETQITSGTDDWEPKWSPDGSRLAFWRVADGHDEIWVINADGTNATPITSGPDSDVSPNWSANGSFLVFSSTRTGDGGSYLHTYEVATGDIVRRTFPMSPSEPVMDSWPDWSSNGGGLVFSRALASSPDQRAMWQIDTGTWSASPFGGPAADDRFPAYAPDDQSVAFCRLQGGAYHLFSLDRQRLVDLTPNLRGNSCQPSWR
jgi:hypothetical protein